MYRSKLFVCSLIVLFFFFTLIGKMDEKQRVFYSNVFR